jgi:hypothetical protein
MPITLEPFDIRVTEPLRAIVAAKTGMGKSFLMSDFIYTNREFFYDVWVFAGSEDVMKTYRNILPPSRLIDGWDETKFIEIWDMIGEVFEACEKHGVEPPHFMIIFDDLAFDAAIWKAKIVSKSFMNGRHRNCSMLVATQYMMMLPTTVRTQAQIVFALRETNYENIRKMYKAWFAIIPSVAEFREILMQGTANYGTLVVNTMSRSAKVSDAVKCFRASKTPDVFDQETGKRNWKLCHSRIWKLDQAQRGAKRVRVQMVEKQKAEILSRGGMVIDTNKHKTAPSSKRKRSEESKPALSRNQ